MGDEDCTGDILMEGVVEGIVNIDDIDFSFLEHICPPAPPQFDNNDIEKSSSIDDENFKMIEKELESWGICNIVMGKIKRMLRLK